jgi:hypothetical protein
MTPPHMADTLTGPVRTDAEVLSRVELLIDPIDRVRQSLWLFFLDRDETQLPMVVPVEDVPGDPDPDLVGNLCWTIAEVLRGAEPEGSVIFALTRPGPAEACRTDRIWHERLRDGAILHGMRIRLICLATPDGVLPLTEN